ncbi:MAG: biotin/lipoate--protein ligase family protein [Hyphomicrobiaceae bacterium]
MLQLPPLLTAHAVATSDDPLSIACRGAVDATFGAGDVIWSSAVVAADAALVLEPDVAAEVARQMGPLVMVAAADCLGALLPPQVAVEHRWPGTILVNGADSGRVRLAMPATPAAEIPAWIALAITVKLGAVSTIGEPGEHPGMTTLAEEGGDALSNLDVLQSLFRHVLTWLDIWQQDGFASIASNWMFRAHGRLEPVTHSHADKTVAGKILGLDAHAGLRLGTAEGSETVLDYPVLDGDAIADRLATTAGRTA